MPLLTVGDSSTLIADGRAIRLTGLPDFNADDEAFKITQFDGWFDTADPDVVLVANGGGPGAVASGAWLPKEAAYVLAGRIDTGRENLEAMRAALLASLPASAETTLTVIGNGYADDKQIFVRRSAKPTITLRAQLNFAMQLVSPDPYKYGLTALSGTMGAYSGSSWQETFALTTGVWYETFSKTSGVWYETYAKAASTSAYPDSLTLISDGTVSSRRLTVTVAGPLTSGDWYLIQPSAGDRRMWVEIGIAAGQTLIIDSLNETATINGEDASAALFGDLFTLEPGSNAYRLVTNTANALAYATVESLPAYE